MSRLKVTFQINYVVDIHEDDYAILHTQLMAVVDENSKVGRVETVIPVNKLIELLKPEDRDYIPTEVTMENNPREFREEVTVIISAETRRVSSVGVLPDV